jgi:hypothetical protein
MNERALVKALEAIHKEAVKLLRHDLSEEVTRGLELIASLSLKGSDIRAAQNKGAEDTALYEPAALSPSRQTPR